MSNTHFLIVGGTKGLGRATAQAIAERGDAISVIARRLPTKKMEIGGASYWTADLAAPKTLPVVIREIVRKNGQFTNVVLFQRYRGQGNEWDGELQTTLTGTKYIVDLAQPHFSSEGGSIVLVSSVNARLISKHLPLGYHVGKAGLNQIVRYYAVALGPENIRVNSISPMTFLKDESKDLILKNKKLRRLYQKMIPLGRLATAKELAKTVMFLCSDDSSILTGQDIVLDGGLTILYQEALLLDLISANKITRK